MKKVYNKLIRDKTIDVIRNNDEEPIYRILDDVEYKKELMKKLNEESKEIIYAETEKELLDKLAEFLEVVFALADINDKREELLKVMKEKRADRGGYKERVFLEEIR